MSTSLSLPQEELINMFLDGHTERSVPNVFPSVVTDYRIALIGEAPGEQEVKTGLPFVGGSGQLLNGLLADAKIDRRACFVGNVCQVRPPGNIIKAFAWDGQEIQDGLAQLRKDMAKWRPNIVVLLGNTALHAAKSARTPGKKTEFPVGSWRGSLFVSDAPLSPFYGMKCIATYHPAALLRVYEDCLLARYDLRRARKEGLLQDLVLPKRNIVIQPTLEYLCERLDYILDAKPTIALDIEGTCGNFRCISIATSPWDVFIIPFMTMSGGSHWDEQSEAVLWEKLAKVLADWRIPKVLQNCMYDQFVLAHDFNILIQGIVDDTMLKHWEQFNEVEKALDVQTSIYTRQPYYKSSRKATEADEFHTYCCLDSAVTYEINEVLTATAKTWPPEVEGHYAFNKKVLKPMMYMQKRGMRFDTAKRDERVLQLLQEADEHQAKLDGIAGHHVNVRSPKQMKEFLYRELGLPVQYKRGVRGAEQKETADFEALLKLAKKLRGDQSDMLMMCIRLRERLKRASDLQCIGVDPDGRVRFSYNVVGTITGRLSCYESATGAGTNGQTFRKEDRDLCIADPDCDIGEWDLSGADGWTVAAHCAAHGDQTMLEDLLYGLKIPMLIGLGVRFGPKINALDRATLKVMQKEIVKGSNFHHALKQTQHGTNYGMTASTVALRLFIESYGENVISEAEARAYQSAYLHRYPGIIRWHEWIRAQVGKGYLQTANGSRRLINGRKYDESTVKGVLSHEPQGNTTWYTNKAALNMYMDRDNRITDYRLRSEPLHQIHDALVAQWHKEDREFVLRKWKEWFDIELVIAGIKVKIPAEGGWGSAWGVLPNEM